MQRVVLEQRLGFVATVTAEGRPNLSPKGTTTLWDEEHLMFADLASPGTIENLATNPHVEINVVDPILRKGYRFKGTAAVYTSGQMFDHGLEILRPRERPIALPSSSPTSRWPEHPSVASRSRARRSTTCSSS